MTAEFCPRKDRFRITPAQLSPIATKRVIAAEAA
jgi:hypothetical protein